MTTVAIICEYNPFHNGHKYQVDRVREIFGDDCCILAIMSGNFTQRGDVAIADKSARAKCAVEEGVNLVVELPFPYSMSSAEFFAEAGVYIANACEADFLVFGAENGDIELLTKCADIMLSPEYENLLEEQSGDRESEKNGYAKNCEAALKSLLKGEYKTEVELTPNNILALEYLKAIRRNNYLIKPYCIRREGASFSEENFVKTNMQSATSLRNAFLKNDFSAYDYMPGSTKNVLCEEKSKGEFPCDIEKISHGIISFFRLNPPDSDCNFHDAKGGLYNRIRDNSFCTDSVKDLILLTETKRFTKARIRRAVLFSFFGVTSSEVRARPAYTQLLAADSIGRGKLKKIGKKAQIAILTKPSKTDGLGEEAIKQKTKSDRADSLFQMTKPTFTDGKLSLKFTPYVKN